MTDPLALERRGAPGWLTWLLVAGLVAVYAGERIVPGVAAARATLSGGGFLLVLAAAAWRAVAWRRATGDERAVERIFFLTYAGCALALVGFFLAGDGARWLGLEFGDAAAQGRFRTAAAVLACVTLSASLLPALAAQWAAGSAGARTGSVGAVDRLRVSQLAAAGLTVGLAAPFLLLTGWVAGERNRTVDVSYFRTSSPGTASQQVVRNLDAPLRVLLFFPPGNQVKDQVRDYFRALSAAGGDVRVEELDRLASPVTAQEFGVVRDGTVILAAGDRSERVVLPTVLRDARPRLRQLDGDVHEALMRVAREQRTVYFTVGHGELNDPGSLSPVDTVALGGVSALRSLFGLLNYTTRDLGLQHGLGNDVPSDAAMVLVLGPRRPFLEAELEALDRYLARGGSLLLALEPQTEFSLGRLVERLGVEFRDTPLADDLQHVRFRGNVSDRRLIVTDRVSWHAAVTSVAEAGVGAGLLFMGAGYLEPTGEGPQVTTLVRSLPSTFADESLDFEFDEGREERRMYPLVAAVEGGAVEGNGEGGERAMRAVVFADSELFSDQVIHALGLNAALVADVVRWLGREEELAGSTVSEADVPIVHTRAEDVTWFYTTILGAPSLVLLLGLVAVHRRRRSALSRKEAA